MFGTPSRFHLPLFLALAAATTLPVAHASVVYSTSFENPPFTTGSIAGQDGWSVYGTGNPIVENFFVDTGSQAVFEDGDVAAQTGPYRSDSPAGSLIDLSADIAIFSSSTQTEWQFGALGPGLSQFLGGIDIFPDNSIEAITAGLPVIGTYPRANSFDSTAWNHIDLLFNMTSQTYTVTLNGTTLASNLPFCGDNGPCGGANVAAYGTGFFDTFGATSPGVPVGTAPNDSGYLDNYQVSQEGSTVPEPSTILMAFLGLAAGVARLRRRA